MRMVMLAAVLAAAVLAGYLAWGQPAVAQAPAQIGVSQEQVNTTLATWLPRPREVAQTMIAKYGMPQEVVASRMVWYGNGPWKRTELKNEMVPHDFPRPHFDMLYQTIDYRVPPDKFDELAAYDGSVIVHRTKGELTASCDLEAANFLALNLARDIVQGKRSAAEARRFYGEAVLERRHPEYMAGFAFNLPREYTGFTDRPVQLAEAPPLF